MIEPTPAASAYDYQLLIRHLLHTPLAQTPGQEIVYRDQQRFSYTDLADRIAKLAAGLTELGIRPGSTVAVMDWDSHRYLECFFAVPMMGAVLHTVNIRLSPGQILYTINHAEDDVILVHSDFMPVIDEIRDQFERDIPILVLDKEYEPLLTAGRQNFEFPDLDENTRATTFYTTGTTGLPKGVYFSHRQLVLHTMATMGTLGWTAGHARFHRDDVYMPITPMFHVHGWGVPYVATLMGVKQVYPGRYAPETLLQLIEREKVTFSHCVPTILHMLLNHPNARQTDLSGWKVIIGGAPIPQGLARQALDRGIDVFSGYGMSETCPFVAVSQLTTAMQGGDPDEQVRIRCKTGRSVPLVELRVVDEVMNDIPRDGQSTGEIVVRAPWLTPGYLKESERSDELWKDGYLHTGDIATIDREGYLQVTDRLKDVIKSGGEWISSLELEGIISQYDGVSQVAVIGIPDDKWGERPMALIVKTENSTLDDEAIKRHVKTFVNQGIISVWAIPERVEFVDTIAQTSVGKIDKKLLRRQYSQQ
jgi:fatty-acyl-CoA synthase